MPTSNIMLKQPFKIYLLQVFVIIAMMFIYNYFGVEKSMLYAAVTYLVLAVALRLIALNHHMNGMRYYKHSDYMKSADEFQKSYDFLIKFRWIDTYRYVTMLSSQISYLETALLNIAFCHGQAGDKNKAKEYYIKALTLFPDSQLAKDELKKLDAIKQK